MRSIAVFTALIVLALAFAGCGEGGLDAHCNDDAYETCTEEYNECAGGDGQCYMYGGVDQACLEACFNDYCLCLDDYNCDLEDSNCESAL
jgi:hypothetical protein